MFECGSYDLGGFRFCILWNEIKLAIMMQIGCYFPAGQKNSLNIGSDGDMIWGECGEVSVFISHKDLEKGDFSDVLYTWDCC